MQASTYKSSTSVLSNPLAATFLFSFVLSFDLQIAEVFFCCKYTKIQQFKKKTPINYNKIYLTQYCNL